MYCVYALQMRFFDMTIAFAESFCLSSQIKIRLERNIRYVMLQLLKYANKTFLHRQISFICDFTDNE